MHIFIKRCKSNEKMQINMQINTKESFKICKLFDYAHSKDAFFKKRCISFRFGANRLKKDAKKDANRHRRFGYPNQSAQWSYTGQSVGKGSELHVFCAIHSLWARIG